MKNDELAFAELKFLMRRQVREVGYLGALQILWELLKSVQIMTEVIQEEYGENEEGKKEA